jgi:putative PIN family toxin of toxin-antitoxin system
LLRIVLDTNILVSAVIAKGKPRDLLRLAIQRRYLLVASSETIEEFVQVLQRPKFKMSRNEVVKAKNVLVKTGKTVNVTSKRRVIQEDPDDDIFLNTALDGKADYIVSGDPHLLDLSKYKGIKIVTVDDMLKKLGH